MKLINAIISFICIFQLANAACPSASAQPAVAGNPAFVTPVFDVSTPLGRDLYENFDKEELESTQAAEWGPLLDQFLQNAKQMRELALNGQQLLHTGLSIDKEGSINNQQEGMDEYVWYFLRQPIVRESAVSNKGLRATQRAELRKKYPGVESQLIDSLTKSKMVEKMASLGCLNCFLLHLAPLDE